MIKIIRENTDADYARTEALEYLKNLSRQPVNRKTYNELLRLSQNIILYSDDPNDTELANYISEIRFSLKSEINTKKRLDLGQATMQDIIDQINRIRMYRNKKVYVESKVISTSLQERISDSDLLSKMNDWFHYYNDLLWNNELKKPSFGLLKSKVNAGLYEPSKETIRLNNFYDMEEKQLESVFVHEMIHLYQHQKYNIVDHGRTFNSELRRVNSMLPIEIKRKEADYNLIMDAGSVSNTKFGVVVEHDRGGSGVAVFKLDYFIKNRQEIDSIVKKNYRNLGSPDILFSGIVDNIDLARFKIKRSMASFAFYTIQESVYSAIVEDIEDRKDLTP